MVIVDYAFSGALILFAAGHAFLGMPRTHGWSQPSSVWSFSGSVAAWMIAAVNILRTSHPGDDGIALVALAGALAWIGLMVWLGLVAKVLTDIRIVLHLASAAGLLVFSILSLVG